MKIDLTTDQWKTPQVAPDLPGLCSSVTECAICAMNSQPKVCTKVFNTRGDLVATLTTQLKL